MRLHRRPFLRALGAGLALATGLATAAEPGTTASERREVGSFTGIAVGGPFEVVLRPATREGVEVRAPADVLGLVETRVEGSGAARTLRVELKRGARLPTGTTVRVDVDFVRLGEISLGGSGRISGSGLKSERLAVSLGGNGAVRLAGLDAGTLEVSIGGSGRFEADGKATRLALSLGGSGSVEAARLEVRDAEVSIAGSGDARLHAEGTLEATIAGSGSVVYHGAAQARSSVVGSGSVRKAS